MPRVPGALHTCGVFTLEQARAQLAAAQPHIAELLTHRADLAELRADLDASGASPLGRLAEVKAWEAALYADLEYLAQSGAQVKGFAPLLLDYPGERDGVDVLWCWLEGEPDITWYHRIDTGFAGRRPI